MKKLLLTTVVAIGLLLFSKNSYAQTITPTGSVGALSTVYGTASTEGSFTFTADNVGNNDIVTITAPAGFEVSKTSGSGFAASVQVTASGTGSGDITTTSIFVRLSATATPAGSPYSGSVQLSEPSVTTANVAVAASTVSAKPLTVSGLTAANKPYDATNSATLSGTAALSGGLVGADVVTLSGSGTATFADATVANGKVVTVVGYTLSGADAAKYSLAQPTGLTANITVRTLTISGVTVTSKTYDGNTTAALAGTATLDGVLAADVATVTLNPPPTSGTFDTKNIGTGKAVSTAAYAVTGAGTNYALTQPTLAGNITAKGLTITGLTADNKVYNGNTTATLNNGSLAFAVGGIIGAETVTVNSASAAGTFVSKNVGTAISVTTSGYALAGIDAGNYALSSQPSTTANITVKGVVISGLTASNKAYDGSTAATLNNGSLTIPLTEGGDNLTVNSAGASGTFNTKDVGTGKTVSTTGYVLAGTDAANYTLTSQPTTTANITAKAVTISGLTASDKVYDALTTATLNNGSIVITPGDVIGAEVVGIDASGASGSFATKVVGVGKTVSTTGYILTGVDAGNYSLTQPTTTADITVRGLTISGLTANNKVYNALTAATLNNGSLSLGALQGSDVVTINSASAVGNFNNKNVGVGKAVTTSGYVLAGADAANYTLTAQPSTTANITQLTVTISGLTANNKTYNATTSATLNNGSLTLPGKIGADVANIDATAATGTFANKNVGVGKTVTTAGYILTGADAPNYSLTQPTTTANITTLAATISGLTANNKVYNANTTASLNNGALTIPELIGGDVVTITSGAAVGNFNNKNVGNAKPITTSGYVFAGADAGNYNLSAQPSTSANITVATLTINGLTANNKPFDGTTSATLNNGALSLSGILGSDVVAIDFSGAVGTFNTAAVGNGKLVTTSGYLLTGADAGNYTLTQPTTTANITARTTVAQVVGGVQIGPVINTNPATVAVLGFSLTNTSNTSNFTTLVLTTNADPADLFSSIRLMRSADANYGGDVLVAAASGTSATSITFSSLVENITSGTTHNYFVEVTLKPFFTTVNPTIGISFDPTSAITFSGGIVGQGGLITTINGTGIDYTLHDNIAPTISTIVNSVDPVTIAAPTQTVVVTFSEPMKTVGFNPEITFSAGTWGAQAAGGWSTVTNTNDTYTTTFTHAASPQEKFDNITANINTALSITIPEDPSSNALSGSFTSAANFDLDNQRPTVTVSRNTPTLGTLAGTTDNSISFNIVFSEPVSGFAAADITTNKGGTTATSGDVLSNPLADNQTFLYTLNNVTGDGLITLTIATSFTDLVGNSMALASGPSAGIRIDNTAPAAFNGLTASSVTGQVVTGYLNSTNLSVNVGVPIANELTLSNGKIQLRVDAGSGFVDVGSLVNIPSLNVTQLVNVTKAQILAAASYVEGNTLTFSAIITDNAGNSTTASATYPTLVVDETIPTIVDDALYLTITGGATPDKIEITTSEELILTEGQATTGFSTSPNAAFLNTQIYTGKGDANLITLRSFSANNWTSSTVVSFAPGNVRDVAGNPLASFSNHAVVLVLPPILGAGDMAITSYSGDNDTFTAVFLKDLPAGQTVYFTDNGWRTSSLTTGETTISLVTSRYIYAGTEILISGTTVTPANVGTVSGTALNFVDSGDQLLVFQGSSSSPTFVTGLDMSGAWSSPDNSTDTDESNVPVGLTDNTNALSLNTEVDNGAYTFLVGGAANTATTPALLLAKLMTDANWSGNNNPASVTFPSITTGNNYVLPPDLASVSPANNTISSATPTLTITFNENIQSGMSTASSAFDVELRRVSDNALIQIWNIGSPGFNIPGGSPSATITNVASLTDNVQYKVDVKERVFRNTVPNYTTGIDGTTTWKFTADAIFPTVTSIVRKTPAGAATKATQVIFTVTFSESVTGLAINDFAAVLGTGLSTGAVSAVSAASGTSVDVTVNTIAGDGVLGLSVLTANAISDVPGNVMTDSTPTGTVETYTIDQTAPTVVSIARNSPTAAKTNSGTVEFLVTFSEDIDHTTFTDADLTKTLSNVTVGTATITETSPTSGVFTVSLPTVVATAAEGTLRIDLLPAASINDVVTNDYAATYNTGEVYTIDQTAPTVTSIVRKSPASPTNASSVVYTVTFNDDIDHTTLSDADFTKTLSNVTVGTIGLTNFNETSPGVVDVTLTSIVAGAPSGTIRLDLLPAASINDDSGNDYAATFNTGEVYTIDQTPPTVTSIQIVGPVNGYTNVLSNGTSAGSAAFTVTFSESISTIVGEDLDPTDLSVKRANDVGIFDLFPGLSVPSSQVITGTGSTRTVTFSGYSGAGIYPGTGWLSFDFLDNNSVLDLAGNPIAGVLTVGDKYTSFDYDGDPLSPDNNEWYTISIPEPSHDVPLLSMTGKTTSSVSLQWSANADTQIPTHYLVIAYPSAGAAPTVPADGTYVSDGALIQNIARTGTGTHATTFNNLNSGVSYNFIIYPYTLSNNNTNDNINFKTTAPAVLNNIVTNVAPSSTLVLLSGGSPILSTVTASTGQAVLQFRIRDDGTSPNVDNAPFKFNEITFGAGSTNNITKWTEIIAGAELVQGVTPVSATVNITDNTIEFTDIDATTSTDAGFISDNTGIGTGFKDYTLRIWLQTTLDGTENYPFNVDGMRFDFKVDFNSFGYDNTSVNTASSQLVTVAPGQLIQSGANTVDVQATKLVFNTSGATPTNTNPPLTIGVGTVFPTAPLVYALDQYNNRDKGYALNATVSSTNVSVIQVAPHTNFVEGILTLDDYFFTSAGVTGISVVDPSVSVADIVSTNVEAVLSGLTTITQGPTSPATELLNFSSLTTSLNAAVSPQLDATNANFDFTITDDVSVTSITDDALPTRIYKIVIKRDPSTDGVGDWTKAIGGAEIRDNNSPYNASQVTTISADELSFDISSLDLGFIADNDTKTFELRIWLKNPVDPTIADLIDNKDFVFTISKTEIFVEPSPLSSELTTSATSTANNRNVVIVSPTQLDFTTEPASPQQYDAQFSNAPIVVKARDANQNTDRDYDYTANPVGVSTTPNGSITFPVALGTASGVTPPANGIYTFDSGMKITSAGNGEDGNQTNLSVTSGTSPVIAGSSSTFILNYSNNSTIVHIHDVTNPFSHPTNILYATAANQALGGATTSIDSDTEGTPMEQFVIIDGPDADGSKTVLSSITFNITNIQFLRDVALFKGNSTTPFARLSASAAINGDLKFVLNTGVTPDFSVDDDASLTLTIRASFNSTNVLDNQQIEFTVVQLESAGVSSSFTDEMPGLIGTITAAENKIEVVASKLVFTNPNAASEASIDVNYIINGGPATVEARDGNENLDVDFTGSAAKVTNIASNALSTPVASTPQIDMTNAPELNSSDPTQWFEDGVFTFSPTFQFAEDIAGKNNEGTLSMTAGTGSLPSVSGISPVINVISAFESSLHLLDPTFIVDPLIPYVHHQEAVNIQDNTDSYELLRMILVDGSRDANYVYNGSILSTNTDSGDGLSNSDIDGAVTNLTSVRVRISNPSVLRKIALYSNDVEIPDTEITVDPAAGDDVQEFEWTAAPLLTAGDDSEVELSIRVSFRNTSEYIIDRRQVHIELLNAVVENGSQWFNGNPVNSGQPGDYIGGVPPSQTPLFLGAIDVVATSLDFTTPNQPSVYAGINEPIGPSYNASTALTPTKAGVVLARDVFQILDLDFNYNAADIIIKGGGAPNVVSQANFVEGVLDLDGMRYTATGDGTLSVEANGVTTPAVDQPFACSPVNVIHVGASYSDDEDIAGENIKGGTPNAVIFGVTMTPDHATTSEPSLKKFTFTFDYPYQVGTQTTLKNFRVHQSINGEFDNSTPIDPSLITKRSSTNDQNFDLIDVNFGTSPVPLFNSGNGTAAPKSYYLVVDVDVKANNSTQPLTPQLLDSGYVFINGARAKTDGNIILTQGTATAGNGAGIKGLTFQFASTRPPVLEPANCFPFNGQLNVDSTITQINLKFDVPVWSFDGKAELYERQTNIKVANLIAKTGNYLQGDPAVDSIEFTIQMVAPYTLEPDNVYYVVVEKGSFDNASGTGQGISDNGLNYFGGISSNATMYFKIASKVAPKLLDAQEYFRNTTTGSFSTTFDKRGEAFYMVVDHDLFIANLSPVPAIKDVRNSPQSTYISSYPGMVMAIDSFNIILVNVPQTVFFGATMDNAKQYDVWVFAENDANPKPIPATGIYGAKLTAQGTHVAGTAGPTMVFKAPGSVDVEKIPEYLVCPDSYITLAEPIIIGEPVSNNSAFNTPLAQEFYLLLPTGFQFDITNELSVNLFGSDFTAGSATANYINTTIAKITYESQSAGNSLDNIVISNLRVIGASGSPLGDIIRFSGNASTEIPEILASISIFPVAAQKFTNSFTLNNDFLPFGFLEEDVITAIPGNYIDPVLGTGAVRLVPVITDENDFGASSFSGNGVTNDILSLNAVALNSAFNIVMTHADVNGCMSETSVQYVVYDPRDAVSPKLGQSGNGREQVLINTNFPQDADPFVSPTIDIQGKAGYRLIKLFATVPAETSDAVISSNTDSVAWANQVALIPIEVESVPTSNLPNVEEGEGFYRSYRWDYSRILNASSESKLADPNNFIAENPYNKYLGTISNKSYYRGGKLGKVLFTGVFQSTADFTVVLPFRQEVTLFIPPIPLIEVSTPTITISGTAIYCEDGNGIQLSGYPAAAAGSSVGTFALFKESDGLPLTIPPGAFVDNGNGTATLFPDLINSYDVIRVSYTFKEDESPISGVGSYLIRITPNPIANFSTQSSFELTTTLCVDEPVAFDGSSSNFGSAPGFTNADIESYQWSFDDATNSTGSNLNTATEITAEHTYIETARYNPTLVVTSTYGCSSGTPYAEQINIGQIPDVDFTFTGVSTETPINFENESVVLSDPLLGDGIGKVEWTFDDGTDILEETLEDGFTSPTVHKYDLSRLFNVNLKVTSVIGCVSDATKPIIVLPFVSIATNGAYAENFESSNGSWIGTTLPFDLVNTANQSWKYGAPTTSVIKAEPAITQANVWKTTSNATTTPQSYLSEERSAIYSPSFNISNLQRPMISFNTFTHMEDGDGVVLEYSIDHLNVADPDKQWFVLGEIGEGSDWFNADAIAGQPGVLDLEELGWSNADTQWRESKHGLTNESEKAPIFGASQVVFRFALGVARTNSPSTDGFAFDNVRIGERTRIVLVETFTNLGNEEDEEFEENETIDLITGDGSPTGGTNPSIARINYHVAFPNTDPLNLDNEQDPGARALYYNISQTPRVRMDGLTNGTEDPFSMWGAEEYSTRSLKLADAEINPEIELTADGSLSFTVGVTALRELPAKTVLNIAIMEKGVKRSAMLSDRRKMISDVFNSVDTFKYVLKKMLPNAAGTRFNTALLPNDNRTFPAEGAYKWEESVDMYLPVDDLALIVFLQNEETKEIYQTEIIDLTDPQIITSIDENAAEYFKVFPNPADREMTIELPSVVTQRAELNMYDQMGKVVDGTVFEKGESRKTIDTSTLAAGMYLIQVETSNGILRRKVIVVHKN